MTASLDPDTEQLISGVIAAFNGTALIASHRTETLDGLERIIDIAPVDTTHTTDVRSGRRP